MSRAPPAVELVHSKYLLVQKPQGPSMNCWSPGHMTETTRNRYSVIPCVKGQSLVPCSVNLTGKWDNAGHGMTTINNAKDIGYVSGWGMLNPPVLC